ncbi:TonB-dependent receptor [Uliginosibacterium sp. sgz301328]|uniref:TonB-dependent receptor n=1 Tax=Uliginosibacterium sp. sgz301328 TaxID=3243764 RepID=UPI00359EB010
MNRFDRRRATRPVALHRLVLALTGAFPLAAIAQQNNDNIAVLPPIVVTANPLGSDLLDLVSPTSVLAGKELFRRRASTLGETLNGLPGVASSDFGPNASRPVIRGLDENRIRLLQNGVGTLDVSALSPDHAVPVDPLVVDRIEVVRGAAALMYGGSAVGGVVNSIDSRVPTAAIEGLTGRAEARLGGAAIERSGAVVLEGGDGRVALHVDGYRRITDDLSIPGYARSARLRGQSPQDEEARDKLPNSDSTSNGGAAGASVTLDHGYAGVSYSGFNTDYGTVAEEDVRIRMKSNRWDFASEFSDLGSAISKVRVRAAYTDYQHREIEDGEVGTIFNNKGWEASLEATHGAIGPLMGVVGLQLARSDFNALGDEALLPDVRTRSQAGYVYEEMPVGKLKLTFGGRVENVDIDSAGGGPEDLNVPGTSRFGDPQRRSFTPTSGALGGLYDLGRGFSAGANLSHTERAPTYNELFSNGPHVATSQYEVGDPDLSRERSNGVDAQLRWKKDKHSASVSAYYTRFANYIALYNTGNTRGSDGELNPVDVNGDGIADASGADILPEAQQRGVRARFAGLEAQGTYRAYEGRHGVVDLQAMADYIRASNVDTGQPLPRISPMHLGVGADYGFGRWGASVDIKYGAAQRRVAANELPTDDYTVVNAVFSYALPVHGATLSAFLKLNNLFDAEVREHSSVLKDIAPQGGRSAMLGIQGTF